MAEPFSLTSLGVVMAARCGYSLASDVAAQVAEGSRAVCATRSARFAGVGTLWLCPLSYFEWLLINNALPGTSLAAALAKTGIDLLVVRPVNGVTSMALCEALRSGSWDRVCAKVRQDFVPLQVGTSAIRVGANVVTFLMFPHVAQQMLFLTAVHFSANVWASNRVNRDIEEEDEDACTDFSCAADSSHLPATPAAVHVVSVRCAPDRAQLPAPAVDARREEGSLEGFCGAGFGEARCGEGIVLRRRRLRRFSGSTL
eukprot:TRINITY_DN13300_c0_g1_i1.p1 TRINITY_DN13300_c0_g1~~TRINITY_DN13300_c0_g1_i1.p1  ORF type:complete len:257 (+),score=67.95 TRINITY_DN13300_c0_g1_i1:139-909(+)